MTETIQTLLTDDNFQHEVIDVGLISTEKHFNENLDKIFSRTPLGMSTKDRTIVNHFTEESKELFAAIEAYGGDLTNDEKLLHIVEECGDLVNVLMQIVTPFGIDIKTVLAFNNVKTELFEEKIKNGGS